TNASYTTPATTTSDNGAVYSVVVSNSAGSVTSSNATLTVDSTVVAPTITTQPANQTVTVGQSASFSVVASGTAPLTYQWQNNGTNIAGATNASYTTPATTSSDNGAVYSVVVSNSAGSVTSNNVTLTVSTPPGGGLVGYWNLDDGSGTTAADSSGNGNTGTLRNGAPWTTGTVGGALQLNGSNQDVRVANSSSLNVTGTELTLAAWIYPTSATNGDIIHKDAQYSIYRRSSGVIAYADSATWSY